jgi:hypothetical protein
MGLDVTGIGFGVLLTEGGTQGRKGEKEETKAVEFQVG